MQWLANSGWLRMPIHQFRSCHAARPIATCHAMSPPFLTCLTYKSYSVSEPMLCKAGRLWMLHDAAWIGLWSPLFVCDVLHRAAESAINRSSWVQSRKRGDKHANFLTCLLQVLLDLYQLQRSFHYFWQHSQSASRIPGLAKLVAGSAKCHLRLGLCATSLLQICPLWRSMAGDGRWHAVRRECQPRNWRKHTGQPVKQWHDFRQVRNLIITLGVGKTWSWQL